MDTNNVTNIIYMFDICSSLISLPDISKWNTNNVISMNDIFNISLFTTSSSLIHKAFFNIFF